MKTCRLTGEWVATLRTVVVLHVVIVPFAFGVLTRENQLKKDTNVQLANNRAACLVHC